MFFMYCWSDHSYPAGALKYESLVFSAEEGHTLREVISMQPLHNILGNYK